MSVPGVVTGRNLVIASVQTASSGNTTPAFINNTTVPVFRDNGGDLVAGDTWYDPFARLYHVYDGTQWIVTGGVGMTETLQLEINTLASKVATLEALTSNMEVTLVNLAAEVETLKNRDLVLNGYIETLEQEIARVEQKLDDYIEDHDDSQAVGLETGTQTNG